MQSVNTSLEGLVVGFIYHTDVEMDESFCRI